MSSVLRASRLVRLANTRAFHSPFAVLADKAPASRTSAVAASDYELEYAARTVYVVAEPEPVDDKYGVPAGAYPVGVPYSSARAASADTSSTSTQAKATHA
ncbi:hypothetical protein K488DRAFT_83130 [Vararia minispora EC-137]|uniref:Uncharacterized protein n=1 Tax=Vararia minispora EC-137 TaxID=1314806 RepID=A0ACB8QU58_9AGAM|nr:hypothetical protein K488DRAFT_83130 [Vararia minispora EC-137]